MCVLVCFLCLVYLFCLVEEMAVMCSAVMFVLFVSAMFAFSEAIPVVRTKEEHRQVVFSGTNVLF